MLASVAILVYGERDSQRNALTEDKYRDFCDCLKSAGVRVASVLYSDDQVSELEHVLKAFNAVLVWINPIENGKDRKKLDSLLTRIASSGIIVSAHPEVILKMGTKDILYKTREMDWGVDTEIYSSFEDFVKLFPKSLARSGKRVLKQYRGNGGNGVFKVSDDNGKLTVIHAIAGDVERTFSAEDFFNEFKIFFERNGLMIDQEWNNNSKNGMVRCYVCGTKVAGFGYQEINALYGSDSSDKKYIPPGKRYYYTENCGLFSDLRHLMETKWIPELQHSLQLSEDLLPVIWDADFFINTPEDARSNKKYTLCEINVSCVSPFPPSAIKFMVSEVQRRITNRHN